ncbi:hypothetical protein ACQPZQ_31745 [Pseudonocardia sp. CA-142604]
MFSIAPALRHRRRHTLPARPEPSSPINRYRSNFTVQGNTETVFFHV